MKNKERKLTVTIVARFGSGWQQEIQGNSLLVILNAWKSHMMSSHKKNDAVISEEEEEL